MVMVPIDLCDEIDFELTSEGIVIECSEPSLPTDERNILWKVVQAVSKESGRRFGIRISLTKNIPMAAGLGGGSSDAATLLKALNQSLKLDWTEEKLIQIGAGIGADVPFFLKKGAQRVEGIGEILTPYPRTPLSLVLINPGIPISTAEAYRWWDNAALSPLREREGERGQSRLTAITLNATRLTLENDLEKVVIPRYPVLAEIKEKLLDAGARGSLMSGSGATVFGLFDSPAARDQGYNFLLSRLDPQWWIWKGKNLGGEESNLD